MLFLLISSLHSTLHRPAAVTHVLDVVCHGDGVTQHLRQVAGDAQSFRALVAHNLDDLQKQKPRVCALHQLLSRRLHTALAEDVQSQTRDRRCGNHTSRLAIYKTAATAANLMYEGWEQKETLFTSLTAVPVQPRLCACLPRIGKRSTTS